MIKFFLLFLCMVLTAASNVKNGTEVGQFELGRPNVNGTEGGLRRLMKNFQENGVRRRLPFTGGCPYKQYGGKDRYGGDISCGRYSSHQSIKDACNSKSNCIGYTFWKGNPWCLKTTSSAQIADGHRHVYYEKLYRLVRKGNECDWNGVDKPGRSHVPRNGRSGHDWSETECRDGCTKDDKCNFYSFGGGWCHLSRTCNGKMPNNNYGWTVYKKQC